MSLPARQLHRDPIVVKIALSLESSVYTVAGRLRAVWEYLEEHAKNGSGMIPKAVIDRVVDCQGFGQALADAGVIWWDGEQIEVIAWSVETSDPEDEQNPAWLGGWAACERAIEERRRRQDAERAKRYRQRHVTRHVTQRDASRDASVTQRDGKPQASETSSTCGDRHDNCTRAGAGAPGLSQPAFNTKAGAAEDSHAGDPPQQRGSSNVTQSSEPVRQSTPSPTPEPERPVTPGGRGEIAELLRQAKVEPGVAMEILISPRGTLARVTWAIERTRQRLSRIREKGGKARSGARYLKWMVLKCPEGPDAKLVGGSIGEIPAAGGQVQRVKVLAQLKTMGGQS